MKIRTQDLTLLQLDYAVAKANGDESRLLFEGDSDQGITGMRFDPHHGKWSPSTQWDQAGPIIEREFITITTNPDWADWLAYINKGMGRHRDECSQRGPTPLVAAMRCFVASRLGDEVEISEELCK
jgi:hypothetical protein